MTDPNTDELDEAVAKAAGYLHNYLFTGNWCPPDGEHTEDDIRHPSQNWNALMAAVAKQTTENRCTFYRQPIIPAKPGHEGWAVYQSGYFVFEEHFNRGDSVGEALALAKTIYAAVKDED